MSVRLEATVPLDLGKFLELFHDHAAPKLDTYEQAIYLFIFRHSRLIGKDEVTIGFKSARMRLATGIGEDGKPMSESTVYKKIASLQVKGFLSVLDTTYAGRRLRVNLPAEIPGCVVEEDQPSIPALEELDFYRVPENRVRLLRREGYRCFYTLKQLTVDNFVVEHVVSRPLGDNTYRNCVAASREANNRKGAMSAGDFVRRLFREGFLTEDELRGRLQALNDLDEGRLIPPND